MKTIKKDVLVIGSGLSGLYTALHIDSCYDIAVVSKETVEKSNSFLAQGGIASCMNAEDSYLEHLKDTFKAGANVNDFDAVSLLVKEAPSEIHKLIELGVEFDKDENGMILTTLEGGHSHRRILHANGDATGKIIMETVVLQAIHKKNIRIFEESMAIHIVMKADGQVAGVIILQNNQKIFIQTSILVIATGGIGALYQDTTNHSFSTGDGIALAAQAGCELVNMCFIQFHPTAYYSSSSQQRFLISEALRGEGGILRNHLREAFMVNYDGRGDLAPRDIVARSIEKEIRMSNQKHVWLDMTHKDKAFLMKRFPSIYQYLSKQNIYMEKDFIPVAPVAHYFVGGIMADLNGATNVQGIYACGEVSSTGVHGANRLASNSLLECIVFGKRVALHINETLKQEANSMKDQDISIEKSMEKSVDYKRCQNMDVAMKEVIQRIMSEHVGIVRTQKGLEEAYRDMQEVFESLTETSVGCQVYYELLNMCQVSMAIIEDAMRQESIGCHYKEKTYMEVLS